MVVSETKELIMHSHFRAALIVVLFSIASPGQAQTVDPSGHWVGGIKVEDKELALEVDLVNDGRGSFAGAVTIPSQKVNGMPLFNFVVDGDAVSFQIIKSAPGDNLFKGTMASDGASMSGVLTHDTYSMPYALRRSGAARIEPPATSTAISHELEGTWNGTLSVGGKMLRVTLMLANKPDGTAAGSIVSVDEGGAEFPITTITQKGASLTLDVRLVGGVFAGTANAGTTELVGTFTEGGVALPLTFRRVPDGRK
jgi:hypothetical protein